jgi:small subunit ribosomal protein S2
MAVVSMKALLETGVHFGHRTQRWHPKMKPYIFTERNGVHIIDLQQTMTALEQCCRVVSDLVADGGRLLLVGTKRQAQPSIREEAERCGMPYVSERWLGGTLTNWSTIRRRIDYLLSLEARRDSGEFERLTKKEALDLSRQIDKLNVRLGGIREMRELPDMLYIVDIQRESTAVREANRLDIPIMAVVDTNCDPTPIDYVIPANDDAIRAIRLLTSLVAGAVLLGVEQRKAREPEEAEAEEIGLEDEKYLSAATLARLKELSFKEGEEPAPEQEAAEPEATAEEAEVEAEAEEAEVEAEAEAEVEAEAEAEEKPKATEKKAKAKTEKKAKAKTEKKAKAKTEKKAKAKPKAAEEEEKPKKKAKAKAKGKAQKKAEAEEAAEPADKAKAEEQGAEPEEKAKPKKKSRKKSKAKSEAEAEETAEEDEKPKKKTKKSKSKSKKS